MNTIKTKWFVCFLIYIAAEVNVQAQDVTLTRVEPPSWWVGMQDPHLQLMIYGKNISSAAVAIDHPGVTVEKVTNAENKNFVFVDLIIKDEAVPGTVKINFNYGKKKKLVYNFELKERDKQQWAHQGLDQRDVIYLVTPDRFVNGDPTNDEVKGLKEGKNRSFDGGRHGGDLVGVISKVPYMKDLGITALWLNPVLENDMPEYSYHGYAMTDYYKVDPRYGSNELYKALASQLHKNKIKLIMDMVFNHCGLEHWWMKDMPFADWIHGYPNYEITNHAISAFSDPHAAESDKEHMEQGWFVSQMPDLNQSNPFMATYLIQNSIWWIEYAGLDGIRMDTYPYNKKEFMIKWAGRVFREYPHFYLVGETWLHNEAQESYWAGGDNAFKGTYNSHLSSITDFPLCDAIHAAFQKDGNLIDLYNVLSKDFLYDAPQMNKIFVDNHDMDRFFYTIHEDLAKFKLATTFLLTTRGIPQIFYGTEILMHGHGLHGMIREDFPGGWQGDKRDAFTESGRTPQENEAYEHIKKILTWRKQSDAIANGDLKHFVPYDNVYVYNRKSDKESFVIVINNNAAPKKLDMKRYAEILKGYDSAVDVLSNKKFEDLNTIDVDANTSLILKLNPQLKAERP